MMPERYLPARACSEFVLRQWPVLIGLGALSVPTLISLATTLWSSSDQGQGPIVLLMAIWLCRMRFCLGVPRGPGLAVGLVPMALGLLLYVFGRSQQIWLFEIGGFIPLLAGLLLYQGGWTLLRHYTAPLLFMIFLIPQPSFIVDWLTSDLKALTSGLAVDAASALGYPVARTGVVLFIGQYQLLVADACSGMNSMFSLAALNVFYLYMRQGFGRLSGWLLLAASVPVSILANVIRVLALMLVTYHFGDAAGQGFMHQFAGILLFAVALALLFSLDLVFRLGQTRSVA